MKRPYLCVSALQSESDAAAAMHCFSKHTLLPQTIKQTTCLGFALDERNLQQGQALSPRKVDSLDVINKVSEAASSRSIQIALHVDLRGPDSRQPQGRSVAELSKFFLRPMKIVPELLSKLTLRSPLLQLNGIVGEFDLSDLKALQSSPRLILPIGEPLLALPDEALRDYLSSIAPHVEHLLFDCSGGLGRDLNFAFFKRFAKHSKECVPYATLGLSGGLSSANLDAHLTHIRRDADLSVLAPVDELSIDVESGIRTTSSDGIDRVDHDKLAAFIDTAIKALQETP